jgi:hypothetical protein
MYINLRGNWNVRRLNRVGSLRAAARELARYKLEDGSSGSGNGFWGLNGVGLG